MTGVPDPTSRYAGLPEIAVPGPDGHPSRMVAPRIAGDGSGARGHVVPPAARLDLLALALTGDSTQWWRLADANPYLDPAELERPGRVIDLPDG